ncbi:MAG: hypothetical protein AAFQ95_24815 [Cyanobacteria bacterium J06621_3]
MSFALEVPSSVSAEAYVKVGFSNGAQGFSRFTETLGGELLRLLNCLLQLGRSLIL